MLDGLTDEALMGRYQDGDARAFEVLLRRHRRPVFNFLLRSTGVRESAEDLMQEVFLRIVRGAGEFRREAKFTTWLYSIARNLCVDHSRRMKFRRHTSLDAPAGDGAEGDSRAALVDFVRDQSPGASPMRSTTNKELRAELTKAIESLGEEQREVFVMREYLGLQFKEIADIVGCPENTVKSRMRYALEALRKQLKEYADLAKAPPVAVGVGPLRAG